jgi:lipopolysaccharide export system protein LptA
VAQTLSVVALRPFPVHVNRRLRLTVSTAACLWGLYTAYLVFFSPLLAPRVESVGDNGKILLDANPLRMTEERWQAEQYLSGQPWAAEPKKGYHFRTDSGFFYFKNWDNQVDDGRKVRFQPFAMIWRPKGHDPDKDPYTIVSDSAVVEFTSKFEVSSPNPGRVIGGALEGKVEIRGPEGLSIDGQQFYFGEQVQRVWSDHAIRFRYGLHSGHATGVELDLLAHPNPETVETLAITGIRTVRLLKAVQMQLFPSTSTAEKPGDPVFIDCQGAFEYEFLNHSAKFEKLVRVKQPTGPGQEDKLTCDKLTLIFERDDSESASAPPPPPTDASSNHLDSKLKFRGLSAEGPDVKVSSTRSDMQGWMTSLIYDEQARVIALKSEDRRVRLLQKNNEILCPEITAVLDEDKKQIEKVECRGSGQLFQYARGTDQNLQTSRKKRELSATWQRILKKVPDPETGLDLIELTGRAELKRIGQMSLEADVIGIWVTRGDGRIERGDTGGVDEAIEPKKLLALKDVRFASPQIGGRTEKLEVWFQEGTLPPIPVIKADTNTQRRRRPIWETDGIEQEWAEAGEPAAPIRRSARNDSTTQVAQVSSPRLVARSRPNSRSERQGLASIDDAPEDRRNSQPPVKQRDNPLDVVAEQIQVVAMRDGSNTEIAIVETAGRVHVQQDHGNGEMPLDVTGDWLRLENYGDTNQILQVTGKPAQVQDRKMQLEGPDIRFDRIANRAVVIGPGVLRVPVPTGLDGKPLPKPQLLDVFWKEKLDFDGKVAKFFTNVHSQLNGSDLRCEEMDVTFTHRISFAEDANSAKPTEIQSILCREGVFLTSYEYEGNLLSSKRTARGFEFKLNQVTGLVTAKGPGTLELWRREGGRRDSKRPTTRVDNMRGGEVDSTVWSYTVIDFDGDMRGSTKQPTTTFRDVKRIIYGSVPNSTDTIEEDKIPADGGYMRCQELTLTQLTPTKGGKSHQELKATGNVSLDGRSFSAQAHQVTYDQSKEQYVLTGDGNQPATIWREAQTGARRSSTSAQLMRFIPSKNELSFDRGSGGEVNR